MSPLTEPLSRPVLPQVEGAGDFSIREYEQVAGAITETGTSYGRGASVWATICTRRPYRSSPSSASMPTRER